MCVGCVGWQEEEGWVWVEGGVGGGVMPDTALARGGTVAPSTALVCVTHVDTRRRGCDKCLTGI